LVKVRWCCCHDSQYAPHGRAVQAIHSPSRGRPLLWAAIVPDQSIRDSYEVPSGLNSSCQGGDEAMLQYTEDAPAARRDISPTTSRN
jgi:hypothetical protein